MAADNDTPTPILAVESVSAVFAHDISTPLATAQMNTDVLLEHIQSLTEIALKAGGNTISEREAAALARAPQFIKNNLDLIQNSLAEYKAYLNALGSDDDEADITKAPASASNTLAGRPLRVLLVDDEDIHHDIGEAVLSPAHEVYHEKSGHDALSRCRKENFDVILMDMQMPVLPGPQTTRQLREFIPDQTMIIGLSNMPIQSKKKDLLDCGFNGFLDKPLKLDTFDKLVESLPSA